MSEHPNMTAYLADARWFAGKGRTYDVTHVVRIATLPGPPAVTIDIVTVTYPGADGAEPTSELYQMPLSHYPDLQDRIGHAHIGAHTDDELGPVHSYDAVHDREAMAVYLEAFASTTPRSEQVVGGLTFHRIDGHELDTGAHSTLFSGEQSNSSVAFGEDSLLKIFRKVTPGRNPDIEIHRALTEAESHHIAALFGWIEATPPDMETMDLAMIQQFLRTASDGWDLALASVRNLFAEADLHADEVGGDFAGEAERLGTAVAEVHEVLREHFPTETWGGSELMALAQAMHDRFDAQLVDVPALASYAPSVRAAFDRVAALDSEVVAQRVHGDFHLGQTLRTVNGWKLVDFEGEPAKPLAERLLPDSPWRDVAGMLRSLDYAARSVERDFVLGGGDAADQLSFRAVEWVDRNRGAFISGYLGDREPTPDERALVEAYEADKAVYEVGYEARNRPTWITIPLSALAKLEERAADQETT
jgi:maltokinase